jgi:SlyX protein
MSDPDVSPEALARRVTELEVKAAFTEDLLDTLNETVARQQQQIEALLREVLELRRQAPDEGSAGFRSLRDEVPPHY